MSIKILFIGDVCGKPGRNAIARFVPRLKEQYEVDVVMTNVENSAHGRGASVSTVEELMHFGIDFMTSGNHIWRHAEFAKVLGGAYPVIRPMNYPEDLPGKGYAEIDLGRKGKLLVISLMGKTFFNERTLSEPFRAITKLQEELDFSSYAGVFIDFHAEATSEKVSMGLYLDGKVSAVVGTHTHVPTADERVLPNGTAYITDVGMVGPLDSILWTKKEIVFQSNMYPYNPRFDIQEEGPVRFDSVLIEIESFDKALSIRRINKVL